MNRDPANSAGTWNIDKLDTELAVVGSALPGVTKSMLYVGMWQALFAFHTEDMNLYSINYLHFGQPKSWYFVSPSDGERFESVMNGYFPHKLRDCKQYLRHKTSMLSPSQLKKENISFTRVTQMEGEIVITFPYSYHAGFNHGFNMAESANFASESWVDWGERARVCRCRPSSVAINMAWLKQQLPTYNKDKRERKKAEAAEPVSFFRCCCGRSCCGDGAYDAAPSFRFVSASVTSEGGYHGATVSDVASRVACHTAYPPVPPFLVCAACGVWSHGPCHLQEWKIRCQQMDLELKREAGHQQEDNGNDSLVDIMDCSAAPATLVCSTDSPLCPLVCSSSAASTVQLLSARWHCTHCAASAADGSALNLATEDIGADGARVAVK
jgi:hypothetical protein